MSDALLPGWCSPQNIALGAAHRWRLGPLELFAVNRPQEWRLAWQSGRDPSVDDVEVGPADPEAVPSSNATRFVSNRAEGRLALAPLLADRPLVIRPDTPVWLLAGERVEIFVSSPLWLRIETADTGRELIEVPSFRPSDAWFGPNTRVGELVYATKTRARLEVEPKSHPLRAVTRVTVINDEADPLRIERVKLPAPALPLYVDGTGTFWSAGLSVHRLQGGEGVRVEIEATPPTAGATRVAPARAPEKESNILLRALSAMLG